MLDYEDDYFLEEDKMGMTVTSGSVCIRKDTSNLIGISIGGGAPLCPCLYIVQVSARRQEFRQAEKHPQVRSHKEL